MQIREESNGEELVLNLAPMIDVVFLLLIFFMVATTFVDKEKEMEVELPQAESGQEAMREVDEIVINLMNDGRVILDGEEVDEDTLRDRLERAARKDPETPVTIRGDKKVYHEQVVGVMDACRVAGLINLGVMTLGT